MKRLLTMILLAALGMPEGAAQAPPDTARVVVSPAVPVPIQRVRQRIETLRGRRVVRVVQPVIVVVPQGAADAAPLPTAPLPTAPPAAAPAVGGAVRPVVPPFSPLLGRERPAAAARPPGADTAAVPAGPERITPPRLAPVPPPLPAAQIAPEPLVREVERVLLEVGLLRAVGVHFEFDRAALLDGADRTLDAVGEVLVRHDTLRLEIGGHTDAVGTAAYNQRLSEARAATVGRFLVERWGIAPERLTARGYGESAPVSTNASPTGRALNRRVEFRVVQ